ncbi:MAG: alkaline phosphatase D family protein [Pseudomonadales bacterium]|jgi:alkaline phosphatase D
MTTRRAFLGSAAAGAAAAGTGVVGGRAADAATASDGGLLFRHGVASGDPLSDRVILWTRVTTSADNAVPVRWVIATDPGFKTIVNQGVVIALPARDHTVKVDALGLDPGRTYYYRFDAAGQESPVGRTRTLPELTVSRLRFGVVSCSNLPFGYFNAYARLAEREDLDAVLHLGDYLYEYAPGEYGNGEEFGRVHQPPHELITLADYRIRHAQYKTDPDLQEAHRQHPWICVWDDHESANNSWRDGAENHNPERGEGEWSVRRAAAIRAYHEWIPVREQPSANGPFIYRSFRFGQLADLIMLDTRLYGRTRQLDDRKDTAGLNDPGRTILGIDQQAWLAEQLRASVRHDVGWRLIGQQLMFGQLIGDDGILLNADQWDGYPGSRQLILDQLATERIDNVVVMTGDIHTAWAMDIASDPMSAAYHADTGRGSLAVELVTTSVTSPGPRGERAALEERERKLVSTRPHIRYVNLREHGYLLVDVDAERTRGEFWFVDSILEHGGGERLAAAYVTENGSNHLTDGNS